MECQLTILGTAASAPTNHRSTSAALLSSNGKRLLFDCGEGTQRQMHRFGEMGELDAIFLTHLHADHVLGIPGLLATLGLQNRVEPLPIYGPKGTQKWFEKAAFLIGKTPFELRVYDMVDGDFVEIDDTKVLAVKTYHNIESLGWIWQEANRPGEFSLEAAKALGIPKGPLWGSLQKGQKVEFDGKVFLPSMVVGKNRPGRKIAFSGDTRPCKAFVQAAINADVLVHEATFMHDDKLRALKTKHSTALEAGKVAFEVNAKTLLLTHLPAKTSAKDIHKQAQKAGVKTWTARDGDVVTIPFAEKGDPVLKSAV